MNLYNTLTRKIEPFEPIHGKQVTMYVCGITPYDTTHLGHAFTYMTFDVLQRALQLEGYEVTYVQNVTDIDDDILKRAKQVKQDWVELGNFWTEKFLTDMKYLNMIMPTNYVKATESIGEIIEIATKLQVKGFAYEKEGNVYFSIQKFKNYGKLSNYSREQMIKLSKERGADPTDPKKQDPLDFILWQKSLKDEPSWKSPWGNGRPGWHIECSAMIYKYLGKNIDIHGGGSDLIYPHHESEIAQSETYTGTKPFVNYWMHTGAVGYKGEKMSKSLGNLIMVSDLLKNYSPNTIRYLLLSHHYRKPWEYSEEQLTGADNKVKKINNYLLHVIPAKAGIQSMKNASLNTWIRPREDGDQVGDDKLKMFLRALQNDLDTPSALQVIEDTISQKEYKTAKTMYEILGFKVSIL